MINVKIDGNRKNRGISTHELLNFAESRFPLAIVDCRVYGYEQNSRIFIPPTSELSAYNSDPPMNNIFVFFFF